MKRFKKWMAGIMAVAMLATCMAFATQVETTVSGDGRNTASGDADAEITGRGDYLGNIAGVFKVTVPTGAGANAKIAFTVDPNKLLTSSPPDDASVASGGAPNSTVIFRTTASGDETGVYYTDYSDPLYVTNMSSVAVTVTMFASLSDTKMTILSSGDTFNSAPKEHIKLAVSAMPAIKSGGDNYKDDTEAPIEFTGYKKITPLGLRITDSVAAEGKNFTYGRDNSGDYVTTQISTGLKPWQEVAYMVKGEANTAADWDIPGLAAPKLTMKWMIDPASTITYPLGDNAIFSGGSFKGQVREGVISGGKFEDTATASRTYDAITDKEAYQAGELVTVYVQPRLDGKKLKSVTFTYISEKDGKFEKSNALKATLVTESDGITLVSANGVYSATFPYPSNVAKSTAKDGTTITSNTYLEPYFTIVVG